MSHQGQENQGTGLRDVFDILVKAPPERLQSLTIQLGESPEDKIIHGLCLVVLQRESQALEKFQMLRDNCLANHLAKRLQGGGNLEDFGDYCGCFHELTAETLILLARIFKILSEQRLCESHLRNLAYQRAISTDGQKKSNGEEQEYDQLIEEAKYVCGLQIAELMCSPKDLKSGSYHDSHRSQTEGSTTLQVSPGQKLSERAHNLPSPLQTSASVPSYPTHLEISIPPTLSFEEDKRIPDTSDDSKLRTPILVGECEEKHTPGQSQSKINEFALFKETKDSKVEAAFAAGCRKLDSTKVLSGTPNQTTKPATETKFSLPTATNIFLPKMAVPNEMHKSKAAEEEEEAIFYAFVILHAPEDEDMAESIKQKLEKVVGSDGAIFSDEFAIPGKSTLRCVEDAINNSAFTFLLLTRNFNTHMLEIKTNSALINSVNNAHKYNTVIPLLPRENCMPRENIPIVLQTIVPLEEGRSFEKKIQKALTPAKIKQIKDIWTEGQRVKTQIDRQGTLKQLNQCKKQLVQLQNENLSLLMAQNCIVNHSEQQAGWQQAPNIHIENAQYIMIGNDSQMTVDSTGGADKDNST